MTIIQPYLKSEQIMRCPSDPVSTINAPGWYSGTTPFRVGYGFNNQLSQANQAAITSVATTVLLTDVGGLPDPSKPSHEWTQETTGWMIDHTNNPLVPGTTTGSNEVHFTAPFARHLEMCNVLWADGHVKASKVERFYNANPNTVSNCLRVDQSLDANACK
jgi:prepilin-type processing-associated H-X9-DG protein